MKHIRRHLLWSILAPALMVLAAPGDLAAQNPFSKAIERGSKSVARISATVQSLLGGRRTGPVASGVIVSKDGYIVTEALSLRSARDITITLPDGEEMPATLVRTDPVTHLTLLKVDRKDLTPASLAADELPEVGQWLVIVGNPFGLARTRADELSISVGVVSAVRPVDAQHLKYTRPVIITDVTINPGATGGAMLDLDGNLIGICGPLINSARTNTQLSFAIPVGAVRDLLKTQVTTPDVDAATPDETAKRGYLGAFILDESVGTRGAYIEKVVPGAPADRAGLRADDLVVAVNGVVTPNGRRLIEQLDKMDPGGVAQLTVMRAGAALTLSVTLGTSPRPILK